MEKLGEWTPLRQRYAVPRAGRHDEEACRFQRVIPKVVKRRSHVDCLSAPHAPPHAEALLALQIDRHEALRNVLATRALSCRARGATTHVEFRPERLPRQVAAEKLQFPQPERPSLRPFDDVDFRHYKLFVYCNPKLRFHRARENLGPFLDQRRLNRHVLGGLRA